MGLQVLLGHEWLVSGVDSLLYAHFLTAVGALLQGTLQAGGLPGYFGAFLRMVVLPHNALFGHLVECARANATTEGGTNSQVSAR